MALNVGPDFKQRWLAAPEAVRQAFIDDLSRICDVLEPNVPLESWLIQNEAAQQKSLFNIEQAYSARKAELIEAARIRKQLALERALEKKRAEQQAYAEQLKQDEEQRLHEQNQALSKIRSHLAIETEVHLERYGKNPHPTAWAHLIDQDIQSDLENLRLRLELEAETQIELHLKNLRQQLRQAAKEEIAYLLEHSDLNTEVASA